MDVEVDRDGQATTVTVSGELDLASAPVLEDVLTDLVARERPEVLVDLRDLEFMDATGLRVLRDAHDAAAERGQQIHLVNCARQVMRLLALVGEEKLVRQ